MSFQATIKFALLALAMLFLANLWGLGHTWDHRHLWGIIAAMAATCASYVSQNFFTQAEFLMLGAEKNLAVVGYAGPTDPEVAKKIVANFRGGLGLMAVAVLLSIMSALLFYFGFSVVM